MCRLYLLNEIWLYVLALHLRACLVRAALFFLGCGYLAETCWRPFFRLGSSICMDGACACAVFDFRLLVRFLCLFSAFWIRLPPRYPRGFLTHLRFFWSHIASVRGRFPCGFSFLKLPLRKLYPQAPFHLRLNFSCGIRSCTVCLRLFFRETSLSKLPVLTVIKSSCSVAHNNQK